jgi:hypothetical protein
LNRDKIKDAVKKVIEQTQQTGHNWPIKLAESLLPKQLEETQQ